MSKANGSMRAFTPNDPLPEEAVKLIRWIDRKLSSSDAMEFIAKQVNAGRAVLFSPRLMDAAAFPYEVFIDNRLWMGDSLAEAISKAARDIESETEEDT